MMVALCRAYPLSQEAFDARQTRIALARGGDAPARAALAVVCPAAEHSGAALERCGPGEGPDALDAWLMLGAIGPDDVRRVAYARALALAPPNAPDIGRLRFEAGHSAYADSYHVEGIALLVRVLDDRDVRSLWANALLYIEAMLTHDDWDRDGQPDTPSGLERPAISRFVETGPHAPDIVLAYARRRIEWYEYPQAVAGYEFWLAHWPEHAQRPTVERELVRARAEAAREALDQHSPAEH
jgi:hypothetical protein